METSNRLTNSDKKSSKKTDNELKIRAYLRAINHLPQWFTEHPRFLLSAPLKYEFARQSNHKLFLFFKNDASLYVRDFLNATIRGNEEVALKMLADNPGLLLERGHVVKGITTDYSGRKYSGLTAFQMTLCAGDEVMAMKMKAIFLLSFPETGQAELDRQFNEIFPEGYEAHLKVQRASANKFEREIIDPLIKVFDGIDLSTGAMNEHIIDDLEVALRHENNGSELCQVLTQFREAFTLLAQSEMVFNPYHLLKAIEKYNAKFRAWHVGEDNPHCWLRLDLFWRQVIGFMQRFLPANFGQAFCTGLYDMTVKKKPLERRLNLMNDRCQDILLFPLDVDATCRLGFDLAINCGGVRAGSRLSQQYYGFAFFKNCVEQKQCAWHAMQPASKHAEARLCLIL